MDDKLTLESAVSQVRQSEAVKLQQAVVRGHVDIDTIDRRKQIAIHRSIKTRSKGKGVF